MPMWFLDLLGLLYHSTMDKKHISMYDYIHHPRNWLIVKYKNIIVYIVSLIHLPEQIHLSEHL